MIAVLVPKINVIIRIILSLRPLEFIVHSVAMTRENFRRVSIKDASDVLPDIRHSSAQQIFTCPHLS